MHPEIERELHDLTLSTIMHGRCLAEEWLATGAVPCGTTKGRILEVLKQLRRRQGFDGIDSDLIDLMGDQIRRILNDYSDGVGDRAITQDVDTTWIEDSSIIDMINLAWRWQQFRNAKTNLDDKIAAVYSAIQFREISGR